VLLSFPQENPEGESVLPAVAAVKKAPLLPSGSLNPNVVADVSDFFSLPCGMLLPPKIGAEAALIVDPNAPKLSGSDDFCESVDGPF